jgi:hypothetical protein
MATKRRICPGCGGPKDFYAQRCLSCKTTGGQRADGYRTIRGRYEHRVVIEEYLGRPLRGDEHVHHINGDPSDNRLENLRVVSVAEHHQTHHGSHVTDAEIRSMVLIGYSFKDFLERGIWQGRVARVRKQLRAEGFGPALDKLSRWRMVTAHRWAKEKIS